MDAPQRGELLAGTYLVAGHLADQGDTLLFAGHAGLTPQAEPTVVQWPKADPLRPEAAVAEYLAAAEAAGTCESLHVARPLAVVQAPPCVILPGARGQTLRQYLAALAEAQEGPCTPEEAGAIVLPLLRGLDAAHRALGAHGAAPLHGAISPASIFLADESDVELARPVLRDFGVALLRAQGASTPEGEGALLRDGALYCAPEQCTEGEPLGPWTDVYSLGAVIYELLAGAPPFLVADGASPREVVERARAGAFEPLNERVPGLDTGLVACVHRALARAPGARFQDAAAFEAALTPHFFAAPAQLPEPPLAPGLPRPLWKRWELWLGVEAAAAAVGAALLVLNPAPPAAAPQGLPASPPVLPAAATEPVALAPDPGPEPAASTVAGVAQEPPPPGSPAAPAVPPPSSPAVVAAAERKQAARTASRDARPPSEDLPVVDKAPSVVAPHANAGRASELVQEADVLLEKRLFHLAIEKYCAALKLDPSHPGAQQQMRKLGERCP
jgi:serine/threonine-protein kinase